MALLNYFRVVTDDAVVGDDSDVVHVVRHTVAERIDWSESEEVVDASRIVVHRNLMEEPLRTHEGPPEELPAFFDFANRDLQIHTNIPSFTQEEILFSMAPECFLAFAIVERLSYFEVVSMLGVRRFSLYKGYLDSTRITGVNPDFAQPFDVVAADACMCKHFSRKMQERDLHKALLAFKAAPSKCISSGAWGMLSFYFYKNKKICFKN